MPKFAKNFFAFFGNMATRVESWWALVLLIVNAGFFTWLGNQWELLASQGWAAVVIFACLSAALMMIALSLGYLSVARFRQPRNKSLPIAGDLEAPPTKDVFRRHYRNEMVKVDGIIFYHCVFENVTFHWEGGRFAFKGDCKVRGNSEILSSNRIVRQSISFLHKLQVHKAKNVEMAYYPLEDFDQENLTLRRNVQESSQEENT